MASDEPSNSYTVRLHMGLAGIDSAAWDACVGEGEPFQEHAFLRALEEGGAVGQGTGWEPRYLTAEQNDRIVGALPLYLKTDSYGEFIFDWAWADAYHRAGVPYYPKAVSAIPFTPATGSRLLVAPDTVYEEVADALVGGALSVVEKGGLSGLHFLFNSEREWDLLKARGFMTRLTYQFHWLNRGYETFDDFAADLRSSKRKNILKERRRVYETGLSIDVVEGDAVTEEHLDAMWAFYRDTIGRKWSQAYLTRRCFEELWGGFRDRLVLVIARDGEGGGIVAGTMNVRKGPNLYGRYWGTTRDVPGLHFECCYYRLIEYSIDTGVELFEAGAQGEHKFLRGFVTRPTFSCHYLAHPGGREAIGRYLEEETPHMWETIDSYNAQSPLKHVRSAASEPRGA